MLNVHVVDREEAEGLLRHSRLLIWPVWMEEDWVGDGVDAEILPLGDHKMTERSSEESGGGAGRRAQQLCH